MKCYTGTLFTCISLYKSVKVNQVLVKSLLLSYFGDSSALRI